MAKIGPYVEKPRSLSGDPVPRITSAWLSRALYGAPHRQRIKHLGAHSIISGEIAMKSPERSKVLAIAGSAFAAWTALSLWEEADSRAVRKACTAAAIEMGVVLDCASSDGFLAVFFSLFAAIPFVVGWSGARFLRVRPFLNAALIATLGAVICLFAGFAWTLSAYAPARRHWESSVHSLFGALPFVCLASVALSLLGAFVGRRFRRGAKTA